VNGRVIDIDLERFEVLRKRGIGIAGIREYRCFLDQ
jgi:hypothetical protein